MSYSSPKRGIGGILLASLSAGPIFVASVLMSVVAHSVVPLTPDLHGLSPAMFIVLPLVVIVGFVLSVLPNILGATLLLALGRHNDGARLPVFWAVFGGLSAGGTSFALGASGEVLTALSATGAICALICRRGTVWRERGDAAIALR